MRFPILAMVLSLAALQWAGPARAQTDPSKSSTVEIEAARTQAKEQERHLARQFKEFQEQVLKLALWFERGDKVEDKKKAQSLRLVLASADAANIRTKFSQLEKLLDQKQFGLPEIRKAREQTEALSKDLERLVILFNSHNDDSREQRLKMQKLLEEVKELIRKEQQVRAENERKQTDIKRAAKAQEDVSRATAKVKADLEGKDKKSSQGGEAKDMKSTPKDGGKEGNQKSEARDAGKKKEGEAKDNKDREGKEGKASEAKGADNKDSKSGDPKQGDAAKKDSKGAEAKDASAKGSKNSKGSPSQAKDAKAGDKQGNSKDAAGKQDGKKPNDKEAGEAKGVKTKQPNAENKPAADAKAKDSKQNPDSKAGAKGAKSSPDAKQADAKDAGKDSKDSKQGEAKSGDPKSGPKSSAKSSPSQGQPKDQQGSPQAKGDKDDQQPQPPQAGKNDPMDQIGKKQIKEAYEKMKQAEKKIRANERDDATKDQTDAIAKLKEAQRELEKLLKQMREEELERVLADLKARCERMLRIEQEILAGTRTTNSDILSSAEKKPARQHSLDAAKLGDQQKINVDECDTFIRILENEGTAVVFPEAARQMREDMMNVHRRLYVTDVGGLTQNIEQDVIDTLKEMIKALEEKQDDMKKGKAKPKPPSPPKNSGPPPDPKLLKQLAELKMIRSMQIQLNRRTASYAANELKLQPGKERPEIVDIRNDEVRRLAERQNRIYEITQKIAKGDNK